MTLMVAGPLVAVVIFSFRESSLTGLGGEFTTENYESVGTNTTTWTTLVWTYEVVVLLVVGTAALAYPAAYALWRFVRDPRWKMAILLLCIAPFWTSYVIRTITWVPLFGREGLVNQALERLGVINAPLDLLLYSPFAMMWALLFLFIIFMIAPLFWSMTRIDEEIMAAAASLGASPLRRFFTVVLPMTRAGLMAGTLFVVILGMGEFFTERIVGGAQRPMLAGFIVNEFQVLSWGTASTIAVMLIGFTLVSVAALLRFFDLRKV